MPKVFVVGTISFCVVWCFLWFVTMTTIMSSPRNSNVTFISYTVPSAQSRGPLLEERMEGRKRSCFLQLSQYPLDNWVSFITSHYPLAAVCKHKVFPMPDAFGQILRFSVPTSALPSPMKYFINFILHFVPESNGSIGSHYCLLSESVNKSQMFVRWVLPQSATMKKRIKLLYKDRMA